VFAERNNLIEYILFVVRKIIIKLTNVCAISLVLLFNILYETQTKKIEIFSVTFHSQISYRSMRIFFFLSVILSSGFPALAQLSETDVKYYSDLEDSLKHIQTRVFFSKKEKIKFEANKQFIALWNVVLKDEKSMQYPFDSLKKDVSLLMAPDKKFRIITWNIIKEDQTHAFFGFIQVNNSKTLKKGMFKKETTSQYEYFPLLDKSATVKTPEKLFPIQVNGLVCCMYDVIKSDEEFYTLIGWDGNDKLTQRKFIDILYFKPDGTPVFGKDVFKFPGKFAKRIMFEYASEVAMSLKYNTNRKQIIFSHLAPNG
jgi:hypothetical protein